MDKGPNISEHRAVSEFLDGCDEEAFAPLFEILYPKMLRYFVLRGAGSVAEDLAQDVLTTVYRQAPALRDRQMFFGWLYRVARNQLLQHVRKHHRKDSETVALDDVDSLAISRLHAANDPTGLSIRQWLTYLEPDERQIMLLRYIDELGYQEIATALSIPLGTVKWKIFQAKAKLRVSLKGVLKEYA